MNMLSAFCSTLEYISDKTLFIAFCFVVRGFEALGASAYSTASYVFVVNTFPQHIGSVLVIIITNKENKFLWEIIRFYTRVFWKLSSV